MRRAKDRTVNAALFATRAVAGRTPIKLAERLESAFRRAGWPASKKLAEFAEQPFKNRVCCLS